MVCSQAPFRLLCLAAACLLAESVVFGQANDASRAAATIGSGADSVADSARTTVSGILQRSWSQRRGRHEYYVVGPSDGVRYYVTTDQDLNRHLGRRVTISGTPRVRPGQQVAPAPVDRVLVAQDRAAQDRAVQDRLAQDTGRSSGRSLEAGRSLEDRLEDHLQQHQVETRPLPPAGNPQRAVRAAQHMEELQFQPGSEVVVEGEGSGNASGISPYSNYMPSLEGVPLIDQPPLIDSSASLGLPPLSGEACEHCGQGSGGWFGSGPCPCGPPHRVWVQAEYLLWTLKGSYLPPLVTTGSTDPLPPQDIAGVLGVRGTRVLYGDERILEDPRNGLRLRLGTWLDCCQSWGVEGELFGLWDESESFVAASDGIPLLARPFRNALTDLQDAQLIAYPNVSEGSIAIDTESKFFGGGIRGRWNMFCKGCQTTHPRSGHNCFRGMRADLLAGYRFLRLREDLMITEQSRSLIAPVPVEFLIRDQFRTQNDFHGLDLGFLLEWERCRWTFGVLGRVALGNTRQEVTIGGSTAQTIGGATTDYSGGLLAQRTNSGQFTHDVFTAIPELGLNVGYQLTPRLRATFGYTLIYWNHVVRAGDQIDTVLNPNLFPPEAVPFAGPLRPTYSRSESDFWAQGLDFGLRYVW